MRLIDADALLEHLNKNWYGDVTEEIKRAPTVKTYCYFCGQTEHGQIEERPSGEWTPVSDRLPEYSGLYLISIYDLVTVANFTGEYFCDRQMDKFVDVFAWQPLPEPYKKGGAE